MWRAMRVLPLAILFLSAGGRLCAQPAAMPRADRAVHATPDANALAIEKLHLEIEKLKLEAEGLRLASRSPDRSLKWLTTWIAATASASVTILLTLVGFVVNFNQRKRLQQERESEGRRHELELKKLAQDKELAREKHLLDVFAGLGNERPRVRLGAVAVLVQRIRKIRESGEAAEAEVKRELPTIVGVLIAQSQHEDNVDIQKSVADGLAKALGAILPDGEAPDPSGPSPLKEFDFQGAQLQNAWWRRVDAREVDFYRASLVRAGLREAFLTGAILKNADLTRATLSRACLDKASLQGAKLVSAKLDKASCRGADLTGADLTGADLRGADFTGARLDNAVLADALTDGTIFDSK